MAGTQRIRMASSEYSELSNRGKDSLARGLLRLDSEDLKHIVSETRKMRGLL